jgi:ATP-dependent DNA ligase
VETTSRSPKWIKPQLTRLVDEAPTGNDWVHEIKYDGYRMHARIDGRDIKLLTRTGLDWSHRYKRTIEAIRFLKVKRRAGGLNSPPTHRRYDDGR